MKYRGTNHQLTAPENAVLVNCANDTTMASGATDQLDLKDLPVAATQCDKFEDMSTPLVSVKVFCDNNLDVLFKRDKVTVSNADGKTVLQGALDPTTDLYMVPLHDTAQPQGGG